MIRLLPMVAALLAGWLCLTRLVEALHASQDDLYVYLLGIRAVADGLPLYEMRAPNGDPFLYPPFATLVLWPLSWLSRDQSNLLWTVGTVVVLALIVVTFGWRQRSVWRPPVWWAAVFGGFAVLLATSASWLNLELGQVSALLVLLVLVDVLGLTPARLRGVPLGIAAAIKLTPLVFVLFLLVRGRTRDGWLALGTFLGCSAVGLVVLPRDSVTFWTDAAFHTADRLGYLAYQDNQSLAGFLLRSGAPDGLWPVLAVAFVLFALWQARVLADDVAGMLAVGCAGIVASPISWGHHLFWVVLAGLWLVWSGRPVLGTAVLAVMTWPELLPGNSRLLTAALLAGGVLWWAGCATFRRSHLVSLIRARGVGMGDRDDAFVEFVTTHAADLRRSAFLLCGDWHQAQDLTQSALIKLFLAWPKLRDDRGLLGYARKTLVRTAIDESRRFWHRERATEVLPDEPVPDVDTDISVDVLRALAALPARQRATVVLRYWEDLPVEEVARLLRCGVGTVKSQAARGLAALRQMVNDDGLLEGHR